MLVNVDTADIQAVQNGIATLKTDTAKSLADIAAKIGAVPTADPATEAALQAILGDVNTLDTSIKAADPGAPLPAPAP